MERRKFLGSAAAALAAVALPAMSAPALPVLYGDGVADDTEALQALVNGWSVTLAGTGATIRVSDCLFPHGLHCRVSRPPMVSKPRKINLRGMTIHLTAASAGGFRVRV
jgi:hypothetical protein